mmetsp:Transcript_8639/g.16732  ORF Transcript_8639/g.16732 Transcript_8639/m.16732 type:complete len:372 (+) Transcript_8639:80-1195(+)
MIPRQRLASLTLPLTSASASFGSLLSFSSRRVESSSVIHRRQHQQWKRTRQPSFNRHYHNDLSARRFDNNTIGNNTRIVVLQQKQQQQQQQKQPRCYSTSNSHPRRRRTHASNCNHDDKCRVRLRSFSSVTPKRSPYAVLELNNNSNSNGIVTKGDIQAAFRRLAKAYHPDLNHSQKLTKEECESLMTELVEAYQILLDDDDDFAARFQVGHSSKVALACELYSLGELRVDRFHDVYALKMVFDSDDDNDDHENDDHEHNKENDDSCSDKDHSIGSSLVEINNGHQTIDVHAHPEDSVSDLKRQLEEEHGVEWGLRQQQKQQRSSGSKDDSLERRKDRDGLSIGWELLILREDNNNDDDCDGNQISNRRWQ